MLQLQSTFLPRLFAATFSTNTNPGQEGAKLQRDFNHGQGESKIY